MPVESLKAQARSREAWNFTMASAEAGTTAQPRNLKFIDINSGSPTVTNAKEVGAQDPSMTQMQMMQYNMNMLMQMFAKQQSDFQKQMTEMDTRQRRELATMLQNQQTALPSIAGAGHPLSPNGDYRAIHLGNDGRSASDFLSHRSWASFRPSRCSYSAMCRALSALLCALCLPTATT